MAVWLLSGLKVLPSLHQCAPVVIGVAVVAAVFWHWVVVGPVDVRPFQFHATGPA